MSRKIIYLTSIALILVAGIVSVAKSTDIDISYRVRATGYPKDRHIVQSNDGTIVVLYQRGNLSPSTFGISAKKSTDNGVSWTDLAGVAGAFTQVADTTYSEFSICIDTNDNIYVAYQNYDEDSGNWWVYFRKLTYSAGTWTVGSEKVVSGSIDDESENPSIVYQESIGRIWVAYGHDDNTDGWLEAAYSDDGFQTRTETSVTSSDPNYNSRDLHPALVIRNGNPFIVYQDNEEGSSLWWSSWNGSSWSSSKQASSIKCYGRDFSVTMIGSDVHVVAKLYGAINYTYYNGTSWSTPETISSFSDISPSLITNNVDLWCFASIYNSVGEYNIKYKRRKGSTWDSSWTAITTDNAKNYRPTTPSIVTGVIPFAWIFGSASPYTVKYGILTGPPAPTNVNDGKSGWSNDNTPTFTWNVPTDLIGGGIEGYWWAVDDPTPETGGTWTTTASPTTTSPLSDGTHIFYVKAKNNAGFLGSAGSHACNIDVTEPAVPALSLPADNTVTTDDTPTFTWSAVTDATSGTFGYQLRVYEGATLKFSSNPSGTTVTVGSALSDGVYTWNVRSVDNAGNVSGLSVTRTLTIDDTPPPVPALSSPADNTVTTDDTPTFSWSAVTDATSGTSGYQLRVYEGATLKFSSNPSGTTVTVGSALSDGVYTWNVRSVDNAGNVSGLSVTRTLTIDDTPPPVPALLLPVDNTITTDNTPTFSWNAVSDATSGTSGYQLRVYEGATLRYSSNPTGTSVTVPGASALGDGVYTWNVYAEDNAGNVSNVSATRTLTVDTILPDTFINSKPPLLAGLNTADFTFSSNESNCEFSCQLDLGAWSLWNSAGTITYTGIPDGAHNFLVKARDAAGNEDPTPAAYNWESDFYPPDTSINTNPPILSNQTSATFDYSANESNCTFTTNIDGGVWSGWSSNTSSTYTGLTEGNHTFEVRSRDKFDNEDMTPASYSWTIDLTPPDTPTVSHSPGAYNDNQTLTFTSNDSIVIRYEYTTDGSDPAGPTAASVSGSLTTGVAAGDDETYRVKARAWDAAGNQSGIGGTWDFRIDRQAPGVPDVSPSVGIYNSNQTISFTSSGSSEIRYEYTTDGSIPQDPTTSSQTGDLITTVSAGQDITYRVKARAWDSVNNTSGVGGTWVYRIDQIVPDTTINSNPLNPANSASATFTFSASELGCEYQYRLDGGPLSGWSTTTSESFAGLLEGSHTFEVWARDQAGNVDGSQASYVWVIDLTAPDTTINTAPPALASSDIADFTFSSNESNCEFSCQLDAGAWSAWSSAGAITYTGLPDGVHDFLVKARDAAGNEDPTPAAYSWESDYYAPDTSINTMPPDPSNQTSATITYSANESNCTFTTRIDGGAWSGWSSNTSSTYTGLTEGNHTFEVRSRDKFDNEDTTPASYSWTIDLTPPNTPTVSQSPGAYNNNQTLTFTSNGSSVIRYEYTTDGSVPADPTVASLTGSLTTSVAVGQDVTYRVKARAWDAAGNSSGVGGTWNFRIDRQAPGVPDVSPSVGIYNSNQTISFTSSGSSVIRYTYTTDGSDPADPTAASATGSLTTSVADGQDVTYRVKARAWDLVNNTSGVGGTWVYRIDRQDSDVPGVSPSAGIYNSNQTISFTSSGSSVIRYEYTTDGSVPSDPTTASTSGSLITNVTSGQDVLYRVKARAWDLVGNPSGVGGTWDFRIDLNVPDTTITIQPTNPDPTRFTDAYFEFIASETGCEYSYRLDTGGWTGWSTNTSVNYTGLSEGNHAFEVKARDAAGNEDQTPAGFSWNIDLTDPVMIINGLVPSFGKREISFNFAVSNTYYYEEIIITGEVNEPGNSLILPPDVATPYTIDLVDLNSDGQYQIQVQYKDILGSYSSISQHSLQAVDFSAASNIPSYGRRGILFETEIDRANVQQIIISGEIRAPGIYIILGSTEIPPQGSPYMLDLVNVDGNSVYTVEVEYVDNLGVLSPKVTRNISIPQGDFTVSPQILSYSQRDITFQPGIDPTSISMITITGEIDQQQTIQGSIPQSYTLTLVDSDGNGKCDVSVVFNDIYGYSSAVITHTIDLSKAVQSSITITRIYSLTKIELSFTANNFPTKMKITGNITDSFKDQYIVYTDTITVNLTPVLGDKVITVDFWNEADDSHSTASVTYTINTLGIVMLSVYALQVEEPRVTLYLNSAMPMAEMELSGDITDSFADQWIQFAQEKDLGLTLENGQKVIKARFRDSTGFVTDYEQIQVLFNASANKIEYQSNLIKFKTGMKASFNVYIQEPSDVEVKIYEITGELVKNVWEGFHQGGILTLSWDGTNDYGRKVGQGIYLSVGKVGSRKDIQEIIVEK